MFAIMKKKKNTHTHTHIFKTHFEIRDFEPLENSMCSEVLIT